MKNEAVITSSVQVQGHIVEFIQQTFPELILVAPDLCRGFKGQGMAFNGWTTHVESLEYEWLIGYGVFSFLLDPLLPENFFACGIRGAIDETVFALCRDKDRRFYFRDKFLCTPAPWCVSKELVHTESVNATRRWHDGERYVVYTPDGLMSQERILNILKHYPNRKS